MNVGPLYKDGGITYTHVDIPEWLMADNPPPPEPRPAAHSPSSISSEDEFTLHWFWRYCFPFVMFGVLLACLIVQRG